jgi:hypothetical protein
MTENRPPSQGERDSAPEENRAADEGERRIGRLVSIGLPVVTLVGAVVVGAVASVGSALLVAAAGTLLGTIAFLWTSLRTLSGDAPLPYGLEESGPGDAVDTLAEQKRRALRALKDLENERDLGRIDDADYEVVHARYREEAKEVMRRMDARAAPSRADAERVARAYLKEHLPGAEARSSPAAGARQPAPDTEPAEPNKLAGKRQERITCGKCGGSNDFDAAFCKHCGAAVDKKTDYTDASA